MHPENTSISINHDDSNHVQGEANCAVIWEFNGDEEDLHAKHRQRAVFIATAVFLALSVPLLIFVFSSIAARVPDLFSKFIGAFVVFSSGVISRAIYKRAMEKRLGRKLWTEYDVTSMETWMEVVSHEQCRQSAVVAFKIDQNSCKVLFDDWCGEGYYELPDGIKESLETARRFAARSDWDSAISSLFRLLKGEAPVTIPASLAYLVQKPLSLCLNERAKLTLNTAFELMAKELPGIKQISNSVGANGEVENIVGASKKCACCSKRLGRDWAEISISRVGRFALCTTCRSSLTAQLQAQCSEASKLWRSGSIDLLMACQQNPENKEALRNGERLRAIAKELAFDLPSIILAEMYFGIASLDDLRRGASTYDGETGQVIMAYLQKKEPRTYENIIADKKKKTRKATQVRVIKIVVLLGLVGCGLAGILVINVGLSHTTPSLIMAYKWGLRDKQSTAENLIQNYGSASSAERKTIAEQLRLLNPAPKTILLLGYYFTPGEVEVRREAYEILLEQNLPKDSLRIEMLDRLGTGEESTQSDLVQWLNDFSPDWVTTPYADAALNRLWLQMGTIYRRQAARALLAIGEERLKKEGYNTDSIFEQVNSILSSPPSKGHLATPAQPRSSFLKAVR